MRKNRLAEVIGSLYPGIQGALPVIPDNGSMPDQIGLINALLAVNPWPATAYNVAANTTSFTATQSQVMAAESTVLLCSGAAGAGVALTLPTATVMLATMTAQQGVVGSSASLRILNTTGQTITVTTAAGWTLNGTMTVATATFRDFFVTISGTGTPAMVLQDIGAGVAP